jgi:hypothetical protein
MFCGLILTLHFYIYFDKFVDEIEMYSNEREKMEYFSKLSRNNCQEGPRVEGRCEVQNYVVGNRFLTKKTRTISSKKLIQST